MHKDEAAALRAITAYARKNLATARILDLHFDKVRGAWVASAIAKSGAVEVTATPQGTGFELAHASQAGGHDVGREVRSHAHVRNESAAAFLMRGVVFAAIAAALGLGFVVAKPQVERMFNEAKAAGDVQPTGKSELGSALGGDSGMLETAEKLSRDKKANAAMNRFIKQNAGKAADKLDTLQQLNQTGQ